MEMAREEHAETLRQMSELMEWGLETRVEPFPETEKEFAVIVAELRDLDPADLKGKLVIGGFLNKPYGPDKMRCMECIYYLVHRKWCDLPEISLPAEPDWFCRLWRI